MNHGNKKYNFEALVNPGDTIVVKPANIYSMKQHLRLFAKENGYLKFWTRLLESVAGGHAESGFCPSRG